MDDSMALFDHGNPIPSSSASRDRGWVSSRTKLPEGSATGSKCIETDVLFKIILEFWFFCSLA
jgi:hypothetical protein